MKVWAFLLPRFSNLEGTTETVYTFNRETNWLRTVYTMQNLIKRYNDADVNQISEFCTTAKNLDIAKICDYYSELRSSAPKRFEHSKTYFMDSHEGVPSTGKSSNRREEHLAIAMFNSSRSGEHYELPDGRNLNILDYQTPLKSKQSDKGTGKLDLLGVIDKTLPTVIELKIEGKDQSLADTPLRALLEGLAYCAIVEANISAIAEEASSKFDMSLLPTKPILIVMAPEEYWARYLTHPSTGPWLAELQKIIEALQAQLGLETHMTAIKGVNLEMSRNGNAPALLNICELVSVEQLAGDL